MTKPHSDEWADHQHWKFKKGTCVLNDTLNQMYFIVTLKTFHPNAKEYTSSQVHMEHSLG